MSGRAETIMALCRGVVDYAGTFPPAKLELAEAIDRYARYRSDTNAWMLHRFVVSATDLDAFAERAPEHARWPVSVVCRDRDDVAAAEAWSADAGSVAAVETTYVAETTCEVFVERPFPIESRDLSELREHGAMLKIRLGGATTPSSAEVARVLSACEGLDIALKATAGLHRAMRRKTDAHESHGFVNLLLAATLARAGSDVSEIEALLDETDPAALVFGNDAVSWREHRFDLAAIADARRRLRSFGSCSFDEPVDSLEQLVTR